MPESQPLLLYDGVCALCNWAVRLILKFDRRGTMRFAPLSGPTARSVLDEHSELTGVDSIVLVNEGTATVRSTALLEIARYLGGFWKIFLVARLIPTEIRNSLYDVVAYWRKRVFGRYDACPLPAPEHRHRFVD